MRVFRYTRPDAVRDRIGADRKRGLLCAGALGLALAKDFLGFDLAIVRFAAFPRAELEVLRALPRAADFPLRAVARFLL